MKTYTGSCHCGAVTFEASADMQKVISCNCSGCHKRGLVLTFIPAEQFVLQTGADDLMDYRFNKKMIAHMICKQCGVEVFGRGTNAEGKETVALNIRCLDGVELSDLAITPVDGRSW